MDNLSNSRIKLFALRSVRADKPGKPGEPECEGTTEDSITLSWEPPLKDGGKPIKGYVVEKREKGSKRWTKYVSLLNTSTFDTNLSFCCSLRHMVCWSVATGKVIRFLPFCVNLSQGIFQDLEHGGCQPTLGGPFPFFSLSLSLSLPFPSLPPFPLPSLRSRAP